ncbi:MAG TPA: selenocysteine-specific translation elongation factor [Candidatus Dormibacteraeota bacterium]|nr:selenocysteine-specific translation elongation factor [Candidatus Dormibacteraeota bacterium]
MSTTVKNVIVGTAGHIDHGKSALVEALTGTHPDRLEEEKRRGITIDLGFAFLESDIIRIGLVDVPGHERFVRNMLAGAGGIDLVLFVIAADESIKPQTREHFDICRLLGVSRGIVALTKTDLVEADVLELVRMEVEEFLRGSFLENAPVMPVSARTGAGLAALKQELLRVAAEVPGKDAARYLRLPIDRAFAVKGFGTVVTGTLVSGTVGRDDEVELFPERHRLRVRGVQSGGRGVERAVAGQRTAVNLASVDRAAVKRGMVLAAPGRFETTRRLDARIHLLPSARKMKNRFLAHFHQGTADTIAEILLLDCAELFPGRSAIAQLKLDQPALVLPGDRFVLRQFSPVLTIAGGTVLDALAPRHTKKDTDVTAFLETLQGGERTKILRALADCAPQGIVLRELIARTGWLEEEVRREASSLEQKGEVRIVSEQPMTVVSGDRFVQLQRDVVSELERFHKANPLSAGISREDLRSRVTPKTRDEVFSAVLETLAKANKLVTAGDTVKRSGQEIALLPEESSAKDQIEAAFSAAGLNVPSLGDVLSKLPVESKRAQKLLQILLREQTLVKVTEGLVFHRRALETLRKLLAEHKKANGERLPIGTFKELAGVSRKYAIPLLEYLDRQRVTRRVGDERAIL